MIIIHDTLLQKRDKRESDNLHTCAMKMKFTLTVLVSLATAGLACAATNDLTTLLQRGLFEEEANHQLDAAIGDYKEAVEHFDRERQLAATAIFRLGECYRKLGRTNEAAVQYQRIAREFDDQKELVTLSRQNLTGMGMSVALTSSSIPDAARKKQQQLLEAEIREVERELQLQQTQVETGLLNEDATFATQQKLIELKRQSAALEGSEAVSPTTFAGSPAGASALPPDEDKFLREVQESVQTSPDLVNEQLKTAAQNGYVSAIEFLLSRGSDLNLSYPLVEAAKQGNDAMVQLLLSHGAAVNSIVNGNTALWWAVAKGYMTVSRTLVAHGADVNAKNERGSTPLEAAVGNGQFSAAEFLIGNKAHIDVRSGIGVTPLSTAITKGETDMVKLLLDNHADANMEIEPPNGPSPLRLAIDHQYAQMVQLLLDHGAKPNAVDINGDTALVNATKRGNLDEIRSLIEHGADVNTADKGGSTPLHWAVDKGNLSAAEGLITHKAKIDATTDDGFTPLADAVLHNASEPMVKLLLDNHADANMEAGRSNDRRSPLRWAIDSNHAQTVQLLLDHGAKPNAVDSYGNTDLVYAIRSGNMDMIRMLIEHGADVNVLDKEGRPPLALLNSPNPGNGLPGFHPRFGRPPGNRALAGNTPDAEAHHQIEELLIKAGADPDFNRRLGIWTYGENGTQNSEIFHCASNSINHYTLLEFLATLYHVNADPGFGLAHYSDRSFVAGEYSHYDDLVRFPDFARISIHRLQGKRSEVLHVNVAEILQSGDCSKDVALQAADQIEIARQEHKVADKWYGLQEADDAALNKCLVRLVQVISQGHTNSLTLVPSIADAQAEHYSRMDPSRPSIEVRDDWLADALKGRKAGIVVRSFHLASVVRDANVLLNTWDLSRVRLKRGNTSIIFDLISNPAPDVWLENGDVIEIPELGEGAPATEAKQSSPTEGLH